MSKYKIRTSKGKTEGPFSDKEIISRISRGKIGVDDEISAEPFARWEKISTRTEFYDAFIKRLFSLPQPAETDDFASERKQLERSLKSSQAQKTRRETVAGKTRVVNEIEEAGGGTRNAKPDGGTVHQSEIDELFSVGPGSVAGSAPVPESEPVFESEEGGTGTELAPYVAKQGTLISALESSEAEPKKLAEESALAAEQAELILAAEEKKLALQRTVKRRVFGVAVIVIVGLLLIFGGESPKPEAVPLKKSATAAELAPLIGADLNAKVTALIKEADLLRQFDSPLFYSGATTALRDALSLKEANASVFAKLAESLAYQYLDADTNASLREEALEIVKRGRAMDPHASGFYRAEAIVNLKDRKWEEARAKAVAGIETDPHNPEGAVLLGEISEQMGDLERARMAFEEALKINSSLLRARYGLARLALKSGNTGVAKGQAQEALKVNPFYSPAFLVLSQAARAENNVGEAQGRIEMAARFSRLTFSTVRNEILNEIGSLTNQKVEGASLDSLEYGADQFLEMGAELEKKGRPSEATRFYLAASLLAPDSAEPLIKLGQSAEKVALSYEDYRYVMNIYERAIQRDTARAEGYIRLGILETEQYNWDRAYKLLSQAAVIAPDKAETYVALGRYYYKKQDYLEALKQLSQARELKPNDSEVQYYAGLIRLVVKKDAIKDALPFFEQAYREDPQNYSAMVEWLKLKVLNYEKNFAIKFIRSSLEKEPANPKFYWAMGEVYAANNEHHRAIESYHRALDLDNRDSKVRMSLGTSLQAVGDLKSAIEEYRLASVLDRKNSEGLYKAADLLFQGRNYNQSEELLRLLVSLTPNYPGAHRYLAKIHAVKREREKAIEEMQREVNNNPENYRFVIELAELYMEYEMFDKAVTELSRVSNLPSVSKKPQYFQDKVRAYLLLSRCFRAQSRNESAEASIKLALELDANDPELHRELGYVYYALQRDKEGVKAFNYYLSRNPAATDGEVIRGLIQKMMIEE